MPTLPLSPNALTFRPQSKPPNLTKLTHCSRQSSRKWVGNERPSPQRAESASYFPTLESRLSISDRYFDTLLGTIQSSWCLLLYLNETRFLLRVVCCCFDCLLNIWRNNHNNDSTFYDFNVLSTAHRHIRTNHTFKSCCFFCYISSIHKSSNHKTKKKKKKRKKKKSRLNSSGHNTVNRKQNQV